MADATHAQGVYLTDGGDRLVVASNGKIDVEEGGEFDLNVSALSLGSQANVIGSGEALSSSVTGVLRSFADDGGASVATSARNIQGRTLLTFDQAGGTIRSVQGQLKMLTGVDVTTGIYTAVQGYVEMAGTHVAQTGSTFSCVDASMEITTLLTVDSGGETCGIHVETTGAGTITNNGTCAAILVDKASGAADWPVGLTLLNCTKLFSGTITLAGGTALNAFEITTTSTQTHSSGYQRSLHINHTHGTGAATGSSEINALGVDVQATTNVTTLYAITGYTGSMAGATINRVAGYAHYLDAISGTVAASSCAHLETNGGASYNSIISVRRHAGTIHSVISDMSGGATATNLFEFNAATGPATLGAGNYSSAEGYFTIKVAGSTYRMPFYTGTD